MLIYAYNYSINDQFHITPRSRIRNKKKVSANSFPKTTTNTFKNFFEMLKVVYVIKPNKKKRAHKIKKYTCIHTIYKSRDVYNANKLGIDKRIK